MGCSPNNAQEKAINIKTQVEWMHCNYDPQRGFKYEVQHHSPKSSA